METLISGSLAHSAKIHKSIKKFQEKPKDQHSRIINRIINYQLALIKNEYFIVYHEHSVFVEKFEEKLKKILRREALISKSTSFMGEKILLIIISVSQSVSIEETEDLLTPTHESSMFVGNVSYITHNMNSDLC